MLSFSHRNTDLTMICKPKYLYEISRIQLRSCSCIKWVRTISLYPCQPLPPTQHLSMPGEIALAHHFYFGGKQKSGAYVSIFQLFQKWPQELISISPHLERLQNQHSWNAWGSVMFWFNWEKAHILRLLSQERRRRVQHVPVILDIQSAAQGTDSGS